MDKAMELKERKNTLGADAKISCIIDDVGNLSAECCVSKVFSPQG
jgi:hypothetical protein